MSLEIRLAVQEKRMNEANENQPVNEFGGFGAKLLDTKAVADMLNVSESWVRDHSRPAGPHPRLPAMKLGPGKTSVVRFHPSDVNDFINEQRKHSRTRGARRPDWRN